MNYQASKIPKKRKEFPAKILSLPASFYERETLVVAEELLGKYLVRQIRGKKMVGKIVEVEAYIGESDPACHAYRGLTPRTKIMYGTAGHAYVYFNYGMYFLLNVVTEREGFPAAVLIRALEPVFGFKSDEVRPASGPGKLCRSMQIDKELNGEPLPVKGFGSVNYVLMVNKILKSSGHHASGFQLDKTNPGALTLKAIALCQAN